MADVVVSLKIMPESPEVSLDDVFTDTKKAIEQFGGEVGRVEQVPIAFGLKSLNVIFVMNENIGSTEVLEKQISGIAGVSSVDVTDVRRAIG
jgi:translation elongation factor aEF-1 beta